MLKSAALIAAAAPAIASTQDCSSGGLSPAFLVRKRLDQGPFDIEQDEGWRTALFTTPSEKPLRNPGIGLVGYTWEENGPALAVRDGKRKLAEAKSNCPRAKCSPRCCCSMARLPMR